MTNLLKAVFNLENEQAIVEKILKTFETKGKAKVEKSKDFRAFLQQ